MNNCSPRTQKYIPSPQIVKRVWPVSHAHALSFFLILWFASFRTVLLDNCLLKQKKETAARRETKAAEGRRVTGVSEAGNQARGIDVIRRSLIFCPQFLRRKHENLHNFCVEVA